MAAVVLKDLAAHRGTVRGVLIRFVKDETLADDLVQEALLRATRAASGMRAEASPVTWLTAIALNVARDHFRAAKRQPPSTSLDLAEDLPAPDRPETGILQAEMSGCILGHVTRLPERQRDAVLLHHFAGCDHREIAAVLAVSEGNARIILHRGLATLRASLGAECVLDFGDDIPCERR
ncbi:RNA polymerase sigma factor [Telmatospirillum sp.]|uniref:RNA polymerase sigma factor n=1 Tax=Telmatospirillum sp. TaxID=2079197 RepID=UPI002846E933|nr:RNA polymerase sigma factor [Telmatospirillum sp.]MDR3438409.1 RNA polymerase sigma factor [Telmatospirillum sp.]